ncbi:hypothetical protein SAMN04488137_2632 [Fictibacillus solisalsi]|uniref:Uncharacterized protein n=1 Tax=Fictibacillus solisalsi TaxID=459525 RepID=A0A1G9X8F6_9BACL|nr:hypothetical protein [Fictibacillus solisalsi]SDM92937.1 hypothetical protein SAMN04488137_2632 [Fictibacillus solisalsi]
MTSCLLKGSWFLFYSNKNKQLVSGLFLTAGYSPEIMDQGKTVGYQVFGRISFFIGTLLIAMLAFFLSEKITRINK